MRVLIGGVGYGNLRDLSFGPTIIERLREVRLPDFVEIEDISYHPVSVLHKFKDNRYDKMIFVSATNRGRPPGTIHRNVPDPQLPPDEEIRNCINEAVTGVINLDNLLIMARFYQALPDDVVVVEAEPVEESWGPGLSPALSRAVDQALEMIQLEVEAIAK